MAYILTTARYEKMLDNGEIKKVSEKYLVDALTPTEAEAVTIDRLTPYVSGEMKVTATSQTKICEVFGAPDSDKFYTAKVAFVTINERSGKEKRTVLQWLVGGTDFNDAYEMVLREFNKSMADCELVSLSESKIVEYYPHNNE